MAHHHLSVAQNASNKHSFCSKRGNMTFILIQDIGPICKVSNTFSFCSCSWTILAIRLTSPHPVQGTVHYCQSQGFCGRDVKYFHTLTKLEYNTPAIQPQPQPIEWASYKAPAERSGNIHGCLRSYRHCSCCLVYTLDPIA